MTPRGDCFRKKPVWMTRTDASEVASDERVVRVVSVFFGDGVVNTIGDGSVAGDDGADVEGEPCARSRAAAA